MSNRMPMVFSIETGNLYSQQIAAQQVAAQQVAAQQAPMQQPISQPTQLVSRSRFCMYDLYKVAKKGCKSCGS